jgi:putative aldouronate transport system permease protein
MNKAIALKNENRLSVGWKTSKRKIYRSKYLYIMFLIPFIYYILFHYVPMYGITIAFKDFHIMKGIHGSPWVGFKHFDVLLREEYFWKVLKNTLVLNLLNLVFSFPAPIILALLLNEVREQAFKRVIQTVTYLPYFISTVVLCGMVVNFLSSDGIANQIGQLLGHEKVYFLMRPDWFRTIYIASGIWQGVGWGSIIYMAALTGIDVQLYEAAIMDGANRWDKFLHVTLPGIVPTIAIMFILAVGHIMSVSFEKILLLYNGATYETADVIATYVYRRGMIDNDFSYATAVGMFQAVIGFFFLVTANKISNKVNGNGLW